MGFQGSNLHFVYRIQLSIIIQIVIQGQGNNSKDIETYPMDRNRFATQGIMCIL